jgi:hypothetical protein
VDSLGGGGGGGEAEPDTVKCSLTITGFFLCFLCFLCKGDPYPENGAQRRLGAEDFLCMG